MFYESNQRIKGKAWYSMLLGMQIATFTWPNGPAGLGSDLAAVARTADQAGFEYLALMDHFFQIPTVGPTEAEMLEAYTTLGFLAAHTERVKLLTLISGVHHRPAGLLAKIVTTLDVLSGGERCSASGPAGTRRSRAGWVSDSRRSPSASSCWRRPSSSCSVCGRTTTVPTPAGTSRPPAC